MSSATLSARAIRVVLAGISGLTAGLVRRCLVDQSDITIVSDLRRPEDVTEFVSTQSIDVLVTARTSEGIAAACHPLLFAEGAVPVIAIGPGGQLEVYDCRVLREASLDELLAEIRRVAGANSEQFHN